jgi:hypothetical protein
VLRRTFGHKRDKVTREWRKLNNEEVNDPYSSPNIVQVIEWIRMRWAGHVACMGDRIVGVWTGSSWLRIWTGGGHL